MFKQLSLVTSLLFTALFFFPPDTLAEEQYIRDGFWGGIDAGAGLVEQSFDQGDEEDTLFYLGFKGGYTINPHLLVGLELSGWLQEASDVNDPDNGKGISQVFLITQLYPRTESGFFAKAGGGYVSNWSNRPGEPSRKNGWGLTVGAGYDFPLNEYIALSPFAAISYGETGNWDYRAMTFGLGIMIP